MICLQVWRVTHPPVRGHHWMFTRPLVHVGFLKSWLAGGLNDKVVGRIMQLVHARPARPHGKPLKIYVTGTPTPAKQHGPCPCNSFDTFTTHRLCTSLASSSKLTSYFLLNKTIVSTLYNTLHWLDLLTGSSSHCICNPVALSNMCKHR